MSDLDLRRLLNGTDEYRSEAPRQGDESDSRYWVSVLGNPYFRSSGLTVFSPPEAGNALLLPSDLARVAELCAIPRPVSGHIARIETALKIDSTSAAGLVDGLMRQGLMVATAAYNQTVRSPKRIETIGLVTADRPNHLRRCLKSYLHNAIANGLNRRFVIADGSLQSASIRQNQETVRSAEESGAFLVYLGPTQRRRLREAAKEAGFPEEVMNWALIDPPSCYAAGAVRNLQVLAAAGTALMTVDDDTICRLRTHEWGEAGYEFIGHGDSRETAWFRNRDESTNAGRNIAVSVTALHEATLGQHLRTLWCDTDPICETGAACAHLLRALNGDQGRIRATWLGIAGDSAQYCPHVNLFATGMTREQMASDRTIFDLALTSREVIRGVRRITVTDESAFMTYCAALDCSQVIPPFYPVAFNEDGIFATTLRCCDRNAFIAQVPVAVVHDSTRPSSYDSREPRSAAQWRLAECLIWMTRQWSVACVHMSVEDRLRDLGAHLMAWSCMDAKEFEHRLKGAAIESKMNLVGRCDSVLASGYSYPVHWRQAVESYRMTVLNSLGNERFCVPLEYSRGPSRNDILRRLQCHLGLYGKLMAVWPDLWRFCANERDSWYLDR